MCVIIMQIKKKKAKVAVQADKGGEIAVEFDETKFFRICEMKTNYPLIKYYPLKKYIYLRNNFVLFAVS